MTWRTGTKNPHTLYRNEEPAGFIREPAHARELVAAAAGSAPIPMRLHCPGCKALHVDEGELATTPHRTHACQACGMLWAPAVVPTVGVRFLPGCKNEPVQAPAAPIDAEFPEADPEPFFTRVAELIGYVNRAEGQSGVEYASEELVFQAVRDMHAAWQRRDDPVPGKVINLTCDVKSLASSICVALEPQERVQLARLVDPEPQPQPERRQTELVQGWARYAFNRLHDSAIHLFIRGSLTTGDAEVDEELRRIVERTQPVRDERRGNAPSGEAKPSEPEQGDVERLREALRGVAVVTERGQAAHTIATEALR